MKSFLLKNYILAPKIKIGKLDEYTLCFRNTNYKESTAKTFLKTDKNIVAFLKKLNWKTDIKVFIGKEKNNLDYNELLRCLKYLKSEKVLIKENNSKREKPLLSYEEQDYYKVNMYHLAQIFKKDGFRLQKQLKTKRICIIGAGGSASMLMVSLVGMGIGNIDVIDSDILAYDNLPRQIFYDYKDVGKKKCVLLKRYIKRHNPFINVKVHNIFLSLNKNIISVRKIFKECDLIISAADEPDSFVVLDFIQKLCFKE
jgi:hypothetical protein